MIWEQPIDAKTAWLGYMRDAGLVVAALFDGRLLLLDDSSGAIEHEGVIRERGAVQIILSGASQDRTLALERSTEASLSTSAVAIALRHLVLLDERCASPTQAERYAHRF